MKKSFIMGSVVFVLFAYFVSFAGMLFAGDATLTLDDNAGSSSFVVQDVDKTNQFKVNSDGQGYFAGNVGIGTTSPVGGLHVSGNGNGANGNIYLSNEQSYVVRNSAETGNAGWISWTTNNDMRFAAGGDIERMRINSAGNVGIGTTGPGTELPLNGTSIDNILEIKSPVNFGAALFIRTQDPANDAQEDNGIDIWSTGDGARVNIDHRSTDGTDGIHFRFLKVKTAEWKETMLIRGDGNIGIGTTAPSEKLEVSGNIKASGTVSQGSSKEFKKNISYVSTRDAMNALNKLNPVRFEYKTDDSGEKHLGFIAEDVPDLVAEGDRKHLNSMDITAVLTKVVQEQQRIISELSAKIERLEGVLEKQVKFN